MKFFIFLSSLLFINSANADFLKELEVNCWSTSVSDDGAFLCQYVLAMGKNSADTRFTVVSIAAPDAGGPKTLEQATRACRAMGFSHAQDFELATAKKEETQVWIDDSLREGILATNQGAFLQHLSCGD